MNRGFGNAILGIPMKPPTFASTGLISCILVACAIAGCSGSGESTGDLSSSATDSVPPPTTAPPSTVAPTTVTSTPEPARTTPTIAWDDLPPVDTPADLVPEDYDGRFLSYTTVIDDGNGPLHCTPGIMQSDPPQCHGVPIEGWDWETVEHEEKAGVRWGDFVVIGRWDGLTFSLTEPATPIAWSQVNTVEPDPIEVPCPEPDGGWWTDASDLERVSADDYNDAIDVVNRRPELLGIDIVEPQEARPAGANFFDPDVPGWVPGILVIRLTEIRDGDEAAIRTSWGGPLCLVAEDGPTTRQLDEVAQQVTNLKDELLPTSGVLGVGVDDGEVQVGMWVASVETQTRLDEQFGPGTVRVLGLLWAIDQP